MTPKEALEKAIEVAGSQAALASAIGSPVETGHIYYWLRAGKGVPAEHCPRIERATGVRCEDLRPSVDWAYFREQAADTKAEA